MRVFLRQLRPAFLAMVVFTVLCGVIYPLAVTAVSQVAFHDKAEGSLLTLDGTVVGSGLIGQQFASPQYFHPRPSAAGAGYDSRMSSGSNLGPTNPTLLDAVAERAGAYRAENALADNYPVPVDAVTASASGLDPHISIANARLQAARVAHERGLDLTVVMSLVGEFTEGRDLAVLGDPGVNVLRLNLALDALSPVTASS